jgi:hypothetical protein
MAKKFSQKHDWVEMSQSFNDDAVADQFNNTTDESGSDDCVELTPAEIKMMKKNKKAMAMVHNDYSLHKVMKKKKLDAVQTLADMEKIGGLKILLLTEPFKMLKITKDSKSK